MPTLGFRIDLAPGSAPPFKTTIPKRLNRGEQGGRGAKFGEIITNPSIKRLLMVHGSWLEPGPGRAPTMSHRLIYRLMINALNDEKS